MIPERLEIVNLFKKMHVPLGLCLLLFVSEAIFVPEENGDDDIYPPALNLFDAIIRILRLILFSPEFIILLLVIIEIWGV